MKIKDNYVLQQIVDEFIVVPVGIEGEHINGIIKLNTEGAFIWKLLSEKDLDLTDLEVAFMNEYDIDRITANNDITSFLNTLESIGCVTY